MITLAQPLVTQPVQIFLVVLVIILLTPLAFKKLKVPHIIGMILAGVVIGPYGFNILDRDSSFAIFGQVGLLYLMFLAGLEIDMFHLRLNLRKGLWFGLMTLIIPLVAGVLTSVFLLNVDWLTAMLLGAMYASHTLLSYPVAVRYGITKSPAVLIAIVGTIIAVIGALIILAITVNVRQTGELSVWSLVTLFTLMIVYCVAVLYIYPRLTRWFFKTFNDKVTQFVYVLAMVFLSAWAAQCIGLEPVLGAFFAGLVLNRYVPAASALMGSIEFVGNALFIPYFLISVGMMINLHVVFNAGTLIVAAIMLAVALLSKWLPAYMVRKRNGLTKADEGVIFGLTAAHTAVALAVVTLGHNMGMFDERILNATVLVILITCAIAPSITGINAPKVKVAMMRQEEQEEGRTSPAMRRSRVNNTLIPVANARLAPELVELAALMRNDVGTHHIYALHVRSDNSAKARAESDNALSAAKITAAAANISIQTLDRYDLNIATGMQNAINERDITEIIMGLHRKRTTVIDSFLGPKVEQLLKTTNRMLIITRCFIPVNTVARIVVFVPDKAQYETGFSRWVRNIARLTRQLGCRVIFCCPDDVQPLIRGVLYQENYGVRCEFRPAQNWEELILYSTRVHTDDLLVVVGARPASVSYNDAMADMPMFLQKYFAGNNILVIYPEQFGADHTPLMSFADPMSSDISMSSAPWFRRLRSWLRNKI